MATIERYLTHGLGFKHGKIHRTGNYSEAVAGGVLTWCRHRLQHWIARCLQDPSLIDKIFPALLKALSKVQAQKGTKEKYGILEDLKLTIKQDLVPALKRLVANMSMAQLCDAMQKDAEQAAMDCRLMTVALVDQRYTEKQPNVVAFTTDRALASGFVSEAAGQPLLKGITQHLVPKVALKDDPIAQGIQKSAQWAMKGNMETLTADDLALSHPVRKRMVKTLHPACQQTVYLSPGSKAQQLRSLGTETVDQALDHLQSLLIHSSRLSVLAMVLSRLARFAQYAGSKAMFDPKTMQQTFQTLGALLKAERQAILANPLFEQVEQLMACGAFVKQYEQCLNFGDGRETPNLKIILQSIKTRLNSLDQHWSQVHYQRVHFDDTVEHAKQDQLAILTGLRHLTNDAAPIQKVANELEVASQLSVQGADTPTFSPDTQFVSIAIIQNRLQQLCEIYSAPGVHQNRYLQWLNQMFAQTGVTFKAAGWMTKTLSYQLEDTSLKSLQQLSTQLQHAWIKAQQQQHANHPFDPKRAKQWSKQAQAHGQDTARYPQLVALHDYLAQGKALNQPTGQKLLEDCLHGSDQRSFRKRMTDLLAPNDYLTIHWETENSLFILLARKFSENALTPQKGIGALLNLFNGNPEQDQAWQYRERKTDFFVSDSLILALNKALSPPHKMVGAGQFVITRTLTGGRTVKFVTEDVKLLNQLKQPDAWKKLGQ